MILPAGLIVGVLVARSPPGGFSPFVNEAGQRGLSVNMMTAPQSVGQYGFGMALADFDADGDLDSLILGRAGTLIALHENNGNGQFTDRSSMSGIVGLTSPGGVCAGDLDADGDLDLVISQRGHGPMLYWQVQPLRFVDGTSASGLSGQWMGRCVAMSDLDGDGWLDLTIGNYAGLIEGTDDAHAQAWRNRGDGSFVDVSGACLLGAPAHNFMAGPADVDRDGDPDLFVSNDRAHIGPIFSNDRLIRNDRTHWTDVTPECGDAGSAFFSMGVARADFDANGLVDIVCTNVTVPDQPLGAVHPLFMRTGTWSFDEQSQQRGLVVPTNLTGWSIQAFDADHDADADLHIVHQVASDRLFLNQQGQFADRTSSSGMAGGSWLDYCSVIGDVNGDGAVDVLTNPLGTGVRLYINHEGPERDALILRVTGEWPNTNAIGALVDVTIGERVIPLEVTAGGSGYLGMNDSRVHTGLGTRSSAQRVVVRWPWSGTTRVIDGLPAGACWTIDPPARLGDADHDWDVDDHDAIDFAACRSQGVVSCDCLVFDFDGNAVVDAADAAAFAARHALPRCDFDGDAVVGSSDLGALLVAWETIHPQYDVDGSGRVTGADLAILLSQWSR